MKSTQLFFLKWYLPSVIAMDNLLFDIPGIQILCFFPFVNEAESPVIYVKTISCILYLRDLLNPSMMI